MKIKDEFYLEELFYIMRGVNLQIIENGNKIRKASRAHSILLILMPWRVEQLNQNLLEFANESMRLTMLLSDIGDKIIRAEGKDKDGNLITMQEMMASNANNDLT